MSTAVLAALAGGAQAAAGQDGTSIDDCAPGAVVAEAGSLASRPWDERVIRASRRDHVAAASAPSLPRPLPAGPAGPGERDERLLVISTREHAIDFIDAATGARLQRLVTRDGLRAPVQVGKDGRDVFLATCDGWIGRVDAASGTLLTELRAGIRVAGIVLAGDGTHLAVASLEPAALLVFDHTLELVRVLPARDPRSGRHAPVASVIDAPARRSFVAALPAISELWEVSYDPTAPDIAAGMIHDFQFREGAFVRGYLNPRRTQLNEASDRLYLDRGSHELLGTTADRNTLQVVHLDVRRRIASVSLTAPALPERSASWRRGGSTLLALPHVDGRLSILDATNSWRRLTEPVVRGSVAALAMHEASDRIWLVVAAEGSRGGMLQPLGMQSLELGTPVWPVPGRSIAAAAVGAGAKRLFVGTDGPGAEILALDAYSLRELWRVAVPWPRALQTATPVVVQTTR